MGRWSPLLPLTIRLPAGYLLALGPLLFISVCDVWLQLFSRDQAYAINLAAVGTVAFGCTGRGRGGSRDGRGALSPLVSAGPSCPAPWVWGARSLLSLLSWRHSASRPSAKGASAGSLGVNEIKAAFFIFLNVLFFY